MTFWGLSESVLRFAGFAGIFAVMALLEVLAPRRRLTAGRQRRWITNLAIVGIDTLLVRLMGLVAVPLVAMSAAFLAQAHGWGLLNTVGWTGWTAVAASLFVLDFAIWLQHVASHHVPVLWRLHQMHHADVDFDVTTAIRFHPVEIALSMLWKIAWVLALGVPPIAVLAFEMILNGGAVFNHANARLPERLDRILRLAVVTPDMHRVHHSVMRAEHDSNFGFNLSIWDRLFGTYRPAPAAGHDAMTIGLPPYQSESPTRLGWSLALPFRPLRRDR
jgi:sterol desaturase/sphingolipid hydroxylase (fatty acid hydroxylase superfamily)